MKHSFLRSPQETSLGPGKSTCLRVSPSRALTGESRLTPYSGSSPLRSANMMHTCAKGSGLHLVEREIRGQKAQNEQFSFSTAWVWGITQCHVPHVSHSHLQTRRPVEPNARRSTPTTAPGDFRVVISRTAPLRDGFGSSYNHYNLF